MSMRSRSFLRSALGPLALISSLSVATLGCGKKEAPPAPTTAPTSAAAPPAGAADAGKSGEEGQPRREPEGAQPSTPDAGGAPAQDVAPNDLSAPTGIFAAPAIAMLPKDAIMVGVAVPQKLIDGLGLEKLRDTYATELQPWVDRVQAQVGKNLFQPSAWQELGFDLDGPAGVGAVDIRHQGMALFFTLKDPAALRKAIDELAKKNGATPTEEKVGDATVLSMGESDKAALIFRGNVFMMVVYEHGGGATAMAKELAGRAPEASLASTATYRSAVKGLAADEGGYFMDLGTFMNTMVSMKRDEPVGGLAPLQTALDEAKKAGNADEVARLERAIADEQRWAEKRRSKEAAEAELVKSMFGDLGGLGAGFDLVGDAIEAQVRLPMAPDAKFKKLVKNVGGTLAIVKAMKEAPLFLAGAKIDLPAYMDIVAQAMKADGEDLGEVKAQLKQVAGVDFDTDVLGLFSGELGLGVTGDVKQMMASEEPWSQLGGGAVIGLANPDGMKALLAKVASLEQLSRFVKWDAATSTATVPLPIDKTLTIQVVGSQLVIGTDPELGARAAAADSAGSFVPNLSNPHLKALLGRQDLAGVFVMPLTLSGGWLFAAGRGMRMEMPKPGDPEAAAKYEEYMKLRKQVEEAERAAQEKSMAAMMAAFDRMGYLAEGVTVGDDGLVATIGQYLKEGTVADMVADLVKLRMGANQADPDAEKLREMREQMWKLESEAMRPKAIEAPAVAPVPPKTP
ncbi:MAG: hypothetical protein U1F43_34430 [Myxococcota bacterium]